MTTVPTDTASIYDALNTLVLNSSLLAIVRPYNPPPGIAGFVFDVVTDDMVELESEIPDYVAEDNVPIQDRIILRPEIVRVSGQVAEVVKVYKAPTDSAPTQSNPLPNVAGLQPVLTPGAAYLQQLRANAVVKSQASVTTNSSLYGFYLSHLAQQPDATRQSKVLGYFYQLWKGRQRMTVETPWGFFTDMAIQSLSVQQPERTKDASDFWITFKKVRSAASQTIQVGQLAGRAVFQQSSTTQNGSVGQSSLFASQAAQFNQRIQPPTQ